MGAAVLENQQQTTGRQCRNNAQRDPQPVHVQSAEPKVQEGQEWEWVQAAPAWAAPVPGQVHPA